MQVQLTHPELAKFIDEEVKAGHFPSPDAAVEAAVAQMMIDREAIELSDEDIAAIEQSDAEIDGGEAVEFDMFATEMRKKYCGEQ
jgi:Arc/MetJ-type ribon-helix-helix transcriptional regulator